jgi:hypothetical protein
MLFGYECLCGLFFCVVHQRQYKTHFESLQLLLFLPTAEYDEEVAKISGRLAAVAMQKQQKLLDEVSKKLKALTKTNGQLEKTQKDVTAGTYARQTTCVFCVFSLYVRKKLKALTKTNRTA